MTTNIPLDLPLDIQNEQPVKLTAAERKKGRTIRKILRGEINGTQAAKTLKLTTREVRNLKHSLIHEGDYGISHKNHYHQPANTYEKDVRDEIIKLYRTEYKGMNFTAFARELKARGFKQSRSTIYNILSERRIKSPAHKHKKAATKPEAS